MTRKLIGVGLILVASMAIVRSSSADAPVSLAELGVASPQRDKLIASLREEGPSGLEKAIKFLEQAEEASDTQFSIRCSPAATSSLSTDQKKLFVQAIDQIAGQRYGSFSKLYWYTDWDKAVAAASDAKKPILALKMLGKLTDEFSCANSRFFRSTLYVDPSISSILQDKYVLYWSSVRPVPKISIDFGDGRTLERTITGNSAHYVVDPNGNVIDCMPGLNSPNTFRNWLSDIATFANKIDNLSIESQRREIAQYHRTIVDMGKLVQENFNMFQQSQGSSVVNQPANQLVAVPAKVATRAAISKTAVEMPMVAAIAKDRPADVMEPVPAMAAAEVSASKTTIERPMVAAVSPQSLALPGYENTTVRLERQIAYQVSPVRLSEESLRILRLENPPKLEGKPSSNPDPNVTGAAEKSEANERMINALCKSIYEDEAINHQFHQTLHRWLAENPAVSLHDLNERVYSELFLTPSSDPWLGLVNQDAYTGLMNGGLQWK